MKPIILLSLFCAITASAEVQMKVGTIEDRRTTGEFFKGLEIELNLSGPEIAKAKAIRTTVESATDSTGKTLPKGGNNFHEGEFEDVQRGGFSMDGNSEDKDKTGIKLQFGNPERAATSIKAINASVELLIPDGDPASVVTAKVSAEAGKPLANPAVKAAGIELIFKAPEGEDISYTLKDPNKKIASIEFTSADGKPLKSMGRMSSGFANQKSISISFDQKPPADAVAKIYLLTEKSVVKVPVALKDVPLP